MGLSVTFFTFDELFLLIRPGSYDYSAALRIEVYLFQGARPLLLGCTIPVTRDD